MAQISDADASDQVDLLKLQTFQGELGSILPLWTGTGRLFGLKLLVGLETWGRTPIADEYLIGGSIEAMRCTGRCNETRLEFNGWKRPPARKT
jgi:hypothetical protein